MLQDSFGKTRTMTAFCGQTTSTQCEKPTEQIEELQRFIQENRRKLEEVQQEKLRVEEEIIQCTRETERRMNLMLGKSEVVDVLQQLGHLLQEEGQLSEQLTGQNSEDRKQRDDLEEMSVRITKKARSLTAEILEVEQRLTEAKARNMAAQALIRGPTSKSKRNQTKPK